jgi:O-antigen ligase
MLLDRDSIWDVSGRDFKHNTLSRAELASTSIAVFLAPFASLRFFDLSFTASDLFYCTSLVLLVLARGISRSPLYSGTWLWLLAYLIMLIGLFGSSLVSGDPVRGILVCLQYFFAYILLMPIVVRADIDVIHKLAKLFLVAMIVIDVHGILSFYFVGYVPGAGKGIVTGANRLATILGNPNLAAAMNALSIPTLLYLWFAGRLSNWLCSLFLFIMIATVVLTSSNSGLAALILSTLVFVSFVANGRFLVRLSFIVLLLAIFLYVGGFDLLPIAFQKRVLPALSTGDIEEAGTFVSRSQLMLEALDVISAKGILLLGLGADQFRTISVQGAPVHNLYLLLWVEGGLLALVGWLIFAAVGIYLSVAALSIRLERHVVAISASTTAVFLLVAFSNAHMYGRYWTTPFLINLGILAVQLRARTITLSRQEARSNFQRYP